MSPIEYEYVRIHCFLVVLRYIFHKDAWHYDGFYIWPLVPPGQEYLERLYSVPWIRLEGWFPTGFT